MSGLLKKMAKFIIRRMQKRLGLAASVQSPCTLNTLHQCAQLPWNEHHVALMTIASQIEKAFRDKKIEGTRP